MKIEDGYLKIEPCIPSDWKEYSAQYKWENSVYTIRVLNPNSKNSGVTRVILNGNDVENKIKLDGGNGIYNIEVIMWFVVSSGTGTQ